MGAALVAPALLTTGCIEEVFPTNGVVQEQLASNAKATEATVWGMASHMNQVPTITEDAAYDWGYPSIMHARDVMTDDMVIAYSGYNWFQTWSTANYALNEEYMACQFTWTFLTEQVLTTNNAIKAIPADTQDRELQAYRGAALAFRAATYLDMGRMYEFLPNAYQSSINKNGNDVAGLTVPIVTEKTTEAESRNNPRVTHEQLVKFIQTDLEEAIALLSKGSALPNKTIPSLGVAYGLLARLYLWDATYHEQGLKYAGNGTATELYQKAAEAARNAISASKATPLTQSEWLSTTNGFNDESVSSWMWCQKYSNEDRAITSALFNWTSWMSNEADYGYAAAGPFVQVSAALYRNMSDRDFRKLSYVAPEGTPLAGRESFIDPEYAAENFAEYYSLKFRPGNGNMNDHLVGSVVGVPLMRVEEMYLIEAEATAHNNAADGKRLLTDFMTTYRYPTYKTNATSVDDVVKEVILQKRIELWGEGLIFFDYKRLNMDITRYYSGSNVDNADELYNTSGRPAWMNYVFVQIEGNNNRAMAEWNNPPCGDVMQIIQ